MNLEPQIIKGGFHTDSRGTLGFCNDFDMSEVKRFYKITQQDTSIIRGWRAHKIEQRWFYCVAGSFEIKIVKIDNWDKPNKYLPQSAFELLSASNAVLHVPKGFATSLRATEPNSTLLLFADSVIEDADKDDYLFPSDYFIEKIK